MEATLRIRKNETGEIRELPYDYNHCEPELEDYMWSEGNFSCDCNRGDQFNGNDDGEIPCGDTRYSVQIVAQDSGDVLYQDDDGEAA